MKSRTLMLAVLGILVLLFVAVGLSRRDRALPVSSPTANRLTVAASFYPLAEFARNVGGEAVQVHQIAPTGVDVHDVQLSPQQIVALQTADVFLYNGGGLEPWAERLHAEAERQGVRIVNMFTALEFEQESKPASGETDEYAVNPHLWLDIVLAQRQVEIIRDTFVSADPQQAALYREQAARYRERLSDLDRRVRDGLSSCQSREVIIAHDAFRRLTERYNLTLTPLAGLTPEHEPRPRQLAELVQFARGKGIRVVFSETLVSSRITASFARQIGADVKVLHPLEGLTKEEQERGETYLSLMAKNLEALRSGLGCT